MNSWLLALGLGLSVSFVVSGCVSSDEAVDTESTPPSGLRALTSEESAALENQLGITIVGALPSITVASPGPAGSKQVQGVTVGGPYGSFDSTTVCPYYTGFNGRAGAFIDAIQFAGACGVSETYGGGGGTAFSGISCGDSGTLGTRDVIVGIRGRAGVYIDQLGPICSALVGNNATGGTATFGTVTPYVRPNHTVADGPTIGGNSGTEFRYECPFPNWIVAWSVRYDNYVDQITAFCGH